MIRMIQSKSISGAKAYFRDALTKSDYYLNDQELNGHFRGKISERIGIRGVANKDNFYSLCENIHPFNGTPLTPRKIQQRTTGYDINFHCPKSVSVLHMLSKDNHILDAFQNCVNDIMNEIESDSKTRIRKNKENDNRDTGELLWADFIHQTARPVKGFSPDPHLHCHCFTFNITWDEVEKKYKAGQFRDIKRDMPYYQAKFQKNLSDSLFALGYGIRKTDTAFEIESVPQNVIDLFSKRTNEIGLLARENNITDKTELDRLGSRTRAKKQNGLSMSQLKRDWRQQIKDLGMYDNQANGSIIRYNPNRLSNNAPADESINHSLSHYFERSSVVQDKRLLGKAYQYAIGNGSLSTADIAKCFDTDSRIIKVIEASTTFCTTKEVLDQEREMIDLAGRGKANFDPFYTVVPSMDLSDEQASAVSHLLTSIDQVSIIQGRAGTGKTTLMKEAISHIEKAGKTVFVAAPTSQASRGVLKDEGFEKAETVAKLLVDKDLQSNLTDQVLWVDEAGLLGAKDMTALLALAVKKNARLILSGDTKQHSSVSRGDALRVLQDLTDIQTVSVNTIYRQKNDQYRKAVQALSSGNVKKSFSILNELKSIKTISSSKENHSIAEDYLTAIQRGKSALVIAPTHKQGEIVTKEIRTSLQGAGRISKKGKNLKRLVNTNMTDAEKNDLRNYKEGNILQFNQNVGGGIKRGSAWRVDSIIQDKLCISNDLGEKRVFASERKNEFDVYEERNIILAKGDAIRITRNSFDKNKRRLNNGQLLDVVSVDKKGKILVRNNASKTEYCLPENFGHISYAYCMTSHASQGKTVDEVFIYQPSDTFPATDMKQFYVSVSRGREAVHIYTDDKEALLDHALKSRDRLSALELINDNSDSFKKENAHIGRFQSIPLSL